MPVPRTLVTAPPPLSVVIATYERPSALDVVLRALSEQRDTDFEIVIADEGSGADTAAVIESWRGTFHLEHVWQPNEGFRKARLLNRAARAARGQYLVFLDGDCVPRAGFTRAIRRADIPGWFVASKRLHLSPELTNRVIARGLPIWRWSALTFVLRAPRELVSSQHRQANRPGVLLPLRDRGRPWVSGCHDFRPPYNGYGYVFGVRRGDFEAVNGFDMRFCGWDGEDVDIAIRLRRLGRRCGWPGPDASVLHLWHTPGKQPASPPDAGDHAFEAPVGLRELAGEPERLR